MVEVLQHKTQRLRGAECEADQIGDQLPRRKAFLENGGVVAEEGR